MPPPCQQLKPPMACCCRSTQHLSMLHVVDLAGSHSLSGSSSLAGRAADIGSDEALRQQVSSVCVSFR